jgi:DNA-binding beta-propeller fold protein YncE
MSLRTSAGLFLLLAACASTETTGPAGPVMFPPPPDPPRILFLRSVSSGLDVQPKESSWLQNVVVGEDLTDDKPMGKPCAIAYRDGVYYATDTEVGCIYRLDFANKKADQVELQGRAQLMSPTGICFSPDGLVYVADRARKQVVVLDAKFQWVAELGPWEPSTAPTDVAVWKDRPYVTDTGSWCTRVFDRTTNKQLMVLGNKDSEDEYTRGPSNLAVDDNGYVYVVDTVYSRVYVWDPDGKFVMHIGKPGDAPGHLARPKGVTVVDRKLWVLDAAFDNCQIFDLQGNALLFFGERGDAPGSMSMPRKVWVGPGVELFKDELAKSPDFTAENIIVVTNTWGPKISFYALGKDKKFEYPAVDLPARPSKPAPEPEPSGKPAEPAPTDKPNGR